MDKFFAKSKTIQGIVLSLLPMLAQFLETTALADIVPDVDKGMSAFVTLVGAAWAIYGRFDVGRKVAK